MRLDVVLRVVSKLFIPFILIFALYVQFHGHYSPGGGFQAGVIVAAAVVLHAIVFGLDESQRVVPPRAVEFMVPLGVVVFGGTGVVSMLLGAEYLNYDPLLPYAVDGQYWGIFVVEIGVLITVTGAMITIFYAFAGRGRT